MPDSAFPKTGEFFALFSSILGRHSSAGICRALHVPSDSELNSAIIRSVYTGVLLPSWPFVQDVLKLESNQDATLLHGVHLRLRDLHVGALTEIGVDLFRTDLYEFYDLRTHEVHTALRSEKPVEVQAAGGTRRMPLKPLQQDVRLPPSTQYRHVPPGGTVHTPPTPARRRRVPPPERVMADAPGYELKPDPMTAHDMDGLLERLRALWRWADKPGMRMLEQRSERALSKSTATKLIHGAPNMPPLTQKYAAAVARGCGCEEPEVALWVTAVRLLEEGISPAGYTAKLRETAEDEMPVKEMGETTEGGTVTELRRPASSQ